MATNRTTQRKKKRKGNDNSLYVAIALIVIAFSVLGVIILMSITNHFSSNEANSSEDVSDISEISSILSENVSENSFNNESSEQNTSAKSGWVEENGNKFYFENGNPVYGIKEIDGKKYIFTNEGMLSGGWNDFQGNTYYLNSDGSAHIGFLELDNEIYYLRENGTLAKGEQEIDGKKYFFTSKGKSVIMVNPWNYVPDGYDVNLVTLPSNRGDQTKGKVDKSCYEPLLNMLNDCVKAGNSVYVISGHRTYQYQENNFNRSVNSYISQGYSKEDAIAKTATEIAVPGTSEHHLGLAVDIIDTADWSLSENQANLKGQQWLMENCWKYGFILRYPKNKTNETGIIYEPWHYRYVGTELAKELYELDMTLEAYIESITN